MMTDATDRNHSIDQNNNVSEMTSGQGKPISEDVGTKTQDESEYPAGARLAAIITALALAIFLVSLDISPGLSTICAGLLYTLEIGTSEGKWIGYQIIGGVDWGIASQIPIITVQATAPLTEIAEVTAMLLFLQTIGGAAMVSAAQAGFINTMLLELPKSAPGVDAALLIDTGASDLRSVFSADEIPGILIAYMKGLKTSFAIGTASAGIAFLIIVTFQRWNKLNTAAIASGGGGAA